MSELVMCDKDRRKPHEESEECVCPCYWMPKGPLPSMSAVETHNPRAAVPMVIQAQ